MNRRRRARQRRRRWLNLAVCAGLALAAFLLVAFTRPSWFLEVEYARLRWLGGASETLLQVGDHRLEVVEAGSGRNVVLLHGFTGSKENWLPVFAALARNYRVIAPDLPGWGGSERKVGVNYGFADQAPRVAELLRQLSPAGAPAVLVGHSMGGGIAAMVAARYPDLVERLVLVDAAGVRFADNDFTLAIGRGEHPFEVNDRASLDRQLALVFDHPPWVPWPADQALIAQRIADQPFEREVLDRIARRDEALQPGLEATAIVAPTLLLWCRNDRIVDVSGARLYAERIPVTRTVLLDGCNHMPMMEQPQATADALLQFIGD